MTRLTLALACAALACHAAAAPEGLELTPCTIELVDGTQIEGKLAVQFDMPEHLIVYSPRLATMRSFLKKYVHALTVDGKREPLNPKRDLTNEDKKLLGRVTWPNEPPAKGRKPAYTTETWEKPKQLLVWANPGRSGRFEEPENWLSNGQPMKKWPRAVGEHYGLIFFEKDGTDILFPASSERYVVRPRATSARTRHITAETGVDAEIKLNTCTGNLWLSPHAEFDGGGGAELSGARHTFFRNGRPHRDEAPTTAEKFRALMGSAKSFSRKWVVRKDVPDASMTLIGSFGSGDETHWARGVTILEENSVIAVGPRCTQTVGRDATLILKSGAVLGKRSGNQCYKNDMRIKGRLLAGTPEEPLSRSCYLGISIKDPKGHLSAERARRSGVRGLTVVPGGRLRVHTADPDKARLVITWHGILGKEGGDDGTPPGYFNKLPVSERTINVNFFGDQVLRDVVFDWIGKGDVRLLNPAIRDKWQRVGFGEHNQAEGDALFAKFEPDEDMKAQLARWREPTKVMKWARKDRKKGARYPRILPSGGTFAAGDIVEVRLDALSDPEMRYTLDGGESEDGKVYAGPFKLTQTTTVKAGCFHYPPPHFYKKWEEVTDTFTFLDQTFEPAAPGETKPGLLVHIYEDNSFDKLHDPSSKPVATQTLKQFDLNVPDGRMNKRDGYLYTGYIEVKQAGIYRFYTDTEAASRLYLGERLVVDNHRRYRYDWNPAGSPPLESWGSLHLAPGKHAIRVDYARGSGFTGWPPWEPQENEPFEVRWEGPGVDKQPIPAEALSHSPHSDESTVKIYPAPAGKGCLPASELFAVTVNGKALDVYQVKVLKPHTWAGDFGPQEYERAAMAYFDFEGTVNVEIEARGTVDSVVIRPLRAQIHPHVQDSTISFPLKQPGQLSIEINGEPTHNLQLFTNPIEKDKPRPGDPGVRFFGPGVHFPADDGIEGAIVLNSNETIYIAGGAIVHGTIQTPFHDRVHDAVVRGRGILLGERDTENKRGLMKIGFNCERIEIRDIHLIDSYGWVLEVAWATDVLIHNVKVIAYRGNSDGIDIASCRNVTVRNCYIRSADDNLVAINVQYDPSLKNFHQGREGYASHYGKMIKDLEHHAQKRNTSNVTFHDCILWQDRDHPDAIHVGWSMRGPELYDVQFRDIDILHTRGGEKTAQIDIDTSWWGDEGNVVRDLLFENIYIENAHGGNIIHIRQINQPATIRDIHFQNIRVVGGDVRQSSIFASTPGSRIENITLEFVVVLNKHIESLKDAGIEVPEKYCSNIVIK